MIVKQDKYSAQPRQLFGGVLGSVTKGFSYMQPGGLLGAPITQQQQEAQTIFELTYEKKPLHSKSDYRYFIHILSQVSGKKKNSFQCRLKLI